MNLFLEGTREIGKSSMILHALRKSSAQRSGYMTQRLFEGRRLIGFRVLPISRELCSVEAEYRPDMDGVFLLNGCRNISVLEHTISETLMQAKNNKIKLIVLDEIGGVELTSKLFTDTLYELLTMGKPCIGVLKSLDNLEHTIKSLGLNSEYIALNSELRSFIQSNGQLLTVTDTNKDSISCMINEYISLLPKVNRNYS